MGRMRKSKRLATSTTRHISGSRTRSDHQLRGIPRWRHELPKRKLGIPPARETHSATAKLRSERARPFPHGNYPGIRRLNRDDLVGICRRGNVSKSATNSQERRSYHRRWGCEEADWGIDAGASRGAPSRRGLASIRSPPAAAASPSRHQPSMRVWAFDSFFLAS
jgi:hypothetical protein